MSRGSLIAWSGHAPSLIRPWPPWRLVWDFWREDLFQIAVGLAWRVPSACAFFGACAGGRTRLRSTPRELRTGHAPQIVQARCLLSPCDTPSFREASKAFRFYRCAFLAHWMGHIWQPLDPRMPERPDPHRRRLAHWEGVQAHRLRVLLLLSSGRHTPPLVPLDLSPWT